ncbi:hypothetical protein SAMN02745121_07687 [Nannocystis exedens]|uniref:Ferritin-like domain-containing protein n=1 Tax=Nannocystis exedens TaxID=54 RepID=A0A1I2H4X0_9BACT|nr:hypothetical protein [Nannocystis exedens]PCC74026.1 hypothetical protein NAEX_07115 [Nannocystis exedens]SFF24420.1 hypothetical protein SAMN02745121_07687 [Nannocystis exedens]
MGFNPLAEKGIPLEKQIRNWSELNVQPFDKREVHPYTRTRVIVMNGIEIESALYSHQFARHTDNWAVKRQLALVRRVDQQQQKAVNWLLPGDQSVLETTLAYEQVAVDLTAYLARTEPNPYLRQVLNFGLLEDFDHLYRYANLIDLIEGPGRVHEIVGNLTEVMPGRPTIAEHRHPYDEVRRHFETHTVDPLSRLHSMTILAAEQQTMNFYMNVGPTYVPKLARGLYLEIAEIEEQHVTHYESLLDPLDSWFERELFHHYNECYMYWSFMNDEVDPRIRKLWELHLAMEIEHVRVAGEMLRRHEGTDPAELLPAELPEPTRFEENKQYIRKVLATEISLTSVGLDFVPLTALPADARYFKYQAAVNGGIKVPSEEVIERHVAEFGDDFRLTTEGPHPIPALRSRPHADTQDVATEAEE